MLLDNTKFLIELNELFASAKESGGSVYTTMKRFAWKKGLGRPGKKTGKAGNVGLEGEAGPETDRYPILVRSTLRNKKLSTLVHEKNIDSFSVDYITICKVNMDSLKKKVKPPKKK
ncbi:RNA-binding signal recognition particle subunit srp14 [Kappamyces sp. JEL0829]|nr:RNA-binding signal recognition particle subunit srp14 [Kappamyces sp. JEL0829]KAJ3354534.1 RNA-binding signal recognition particle subunit srp14 [Kappamyces sp. JEL0680]